MRWNIFGMTQWDSTLFFFVASRSKELKNYNTRKIRKIKWRAGCHYVYNGYVMVHNITAKIIHWCQFNYSLTLFLYQIQKGQYSNLDIQSNYRSKSKSQVMNGCFNCQTFISTQHYKMIQNKSTKYKCHWTWKILWQLLERRLLSWIFI